MDYLKLFDFSLVSLIPEGKRKELEIIPLYIKGETLYCIGKDKKEEVDYISYLYNKKILILENDDKLFNLLKDNILLDMNSLDIENKVIEKAIKENASDIHFEPRKGIVNVRIRINGELINFYKIRTSVYKEVLSRIKIKSNMDITEKRFPQDGKFVYKNEFIEYSIRTSTIPIVYGEKLALRILYKNENYEIDKLGLNETQLKDFKEIISFNRGMVIINGPTGSGKSTTLYTILNKIKNENLNITTIEDPVEINIENINQISLDRKVGLGFAEGLRSILRQDPDVIMIGEIRDEETAQIAVRGAITGHKVYSTIHTKSSEEVFNRLEEMGVKKYLISSAIVGLISQRLVKSVCKNCREKIKYNIENKEIYIYKEKGCKECNYTGISGRVLVSSVHIVKEEKNKLKYSNNQMKLRAIELLKEGVIGINEYNSFIKGEDL